VNILANEDAERAWLATIANLSATKLEAAQKLMDSSGLTADDFANASHASVFAVARDFLGRGVPLELFAVEAALGPSRAVQQAGGRAFLSALLHEPVRRAAPAEHARLIREASTRRKALEVLKRAQSRVVDPELTADEVIAEGHEAWGLLSTRASGLGTAEGDAFALMALLDDAQKGKRELVIPTGISALDSVIGGLQPSHLTLVGALPGVGKSALLASILKNLCDSGRKVGFFSLEDERLWVAKRLLSLESGVPLFVLATKPLTDWQAKQIEDASTRVWATLRNAVIDDRQGLTAVDVAETARGMILNHGCQAIIVDHLGELRLDRSERYDLDIAEALQSLRDVAKRYRVPMVVASHVRRRQGLGLADEPSLTDFANSSAPERLARVAVGLSKPRDGVIRVSLLKQTNGRSGFALDLALVAHAAMVDSNAILPPVEVDG
jgi:replicative DNA helicase